MEKIGVIGAGTMGTKIIEKFLENNYEVYVYDKVEEACKAVEQKGAETVKSLKELASKTNKILMVLPGPEQVKSVTKGEKGILSYCNSEHIIVDLSTVDPFTSQENYKLAKNNNAGYLDAPILGRPQKCGEWTLPVGGDKKVLEKINDDFKTRIGAWYRAQNTLAFMVGFEFAHIYVGYSYDLPSSGLSTLVTGANTHEVSLSYYFNQSDNIRKIF